MNRSAASAKPSRICDANVPLRFRQHFVREYPVHAPLALALERSLECNILARHTFEPPVLDLGCGDGLFASMLFADPLDTGVDLSNEEISRARKRGTYRELICCPGSVIPKPEGSYQSIVSNSVLEHIPDLTPVLRESFRLLKPGGCFYLTVPSNQLDRQSLIHILLTGVGLKRMASRYRSFYNRFWKHHHAYSLTEWKHQIAEVGFQVVEAHTYDPKRTALMNDCLMPLALLSSAWRKLFGRWVLHEPLRRAIAPLFAPLFQKWLRGADQCNDGGLVFVMACKPL